MSRQERILVIDDEEVVREVFHRLLRSEGYQAELCISGEEGLRLIREREFDAVILDVMMNGIGGLATLNELRKMDSDIPVIMVTAYASLENAIECMKQGAFDYITKPFKNDEVMLSIQKAIEQRTLLRENKNLKSQLKGIYGFENIVGHSEQMRKVFDLVSQVAPSRSTILITGESGTGKELIAKAIHYHSPRAGKPFVVVNSGSLPPDLLESNLFGHMKGSFTGAIASKKGLFEVADGGSIFLDEIGNIHLDTQSKLLRVIQEKEFMRVGGVETVHVDVRIIAATNSELYTLVKDGKFREDLYYRLNVISIQLPALRERMDDIPLLADYFIQKYCRENDKPSLHLTPQALNALMDYHWPGNVRELENVIERAVVLCRGETITVDLLPENIWNKSKPYMIADTNLPFKDKVDQYRKLLILDALQKAAGVQKEAARMLRIKPTTLNEMIKRYNIKSPV
ncbi:sigma-54 dependent transcriptional regulator [bacterium]|nr:sigma-54 dependent transcriptional regulator [bacterium]MCI0602660.1 sigma-54 dependent transcriptional regulator [bacterium]